MKTKFGRSVADFYLPLLQDGARVIFDIDTHKGSGCILGVVSEGVAVLGRTYIVKPDEKIGDYSCIAIGEFYIEKEQ